MYQAYRFNRILSNVVQSVVLVYQGIAAVVVIASLFLAYNWLKNPFIGGLFEQTMVLNGSNTSEAGKQWALYEQGFGLGDQLKSVGGHPISTADDLYDALRLFHTNETIPVTMRTSDGDLRTVNITLQPFPLADQFAYVLLPAFLSLIFLGMSLWIFGLRRTESAGRAFSMMASSLAIGIGALLDLYAFHRFTYIWTMAVALAGGAVIDLALCFPQEARFALGRPYVRWFGYTAGILLAFNAFPTLYDFGNPTAYFDTWRIIYIFVGLSGLVYFGALLFHAFFSYSPVVKSQARTILFGALLAFGPIVFWLLYASWKNAVDGLKDSIPFHPYLIIPLFFFPLVNGYVILRFRLLRTDYWLRQGIVYSALTVLVVAAYALVVSGLSSILSSIFSITMPSDNPYLIGILVFGIA